ncbi:SDR family NAD(P)-dependent oxidoreductase [Seongchinamella sediminis]|uniref:SDR family NAD(P)-dependent oxidoreductase n=1 Tax=Seongchinamella sediminis TaxID=2283635 RepID=A0A3L7DT05_9GAMM|nr:SDR family oxidoreductase [Seongchinamella sediminis]RLQ20678.1 SDR family NAD(P)-dependent oxidoreductase [Seongchinamella sediminis]
MSQPQTALISGASSGIGEALAKEFAQAGTDLVLVARTEPKLRQLADQLAGDHGVNVWVEPLDLARRSAAGSLFSRLGEQGIDIDILVNNAGVLEHGPFVGMGSANLQRMIDLNISGLTGLLERFLPAMLERGYGKVLNVASIAAFQPVPSLATYAATKAYVLSLTESLSEELRGSGVTITALCPGVTDTNMVSTAQQKSGGLKVPGFLIGNVDAVARQGYQACMKGEVICVPGTLNQAATLTSSSAPKWLTRRFSGLLGRWTSGD